MKTIVIGIPCLLFGGTEIQTLRLAQSLIQGSYQVVIACYFEYDTQMMREYQSIGCHVICLSKTGNRPQSLRQQYSLLYNGLKEIVYQYHPSIAHIQYMAPGALPILIFRQLGIKKIIATLHTDANIYKNLRLIHLLERFVVTKFTCVTKIAEAHFFGDSNPSKHCTIYNCLAPHYRIDDSKKEHQYRIGIVSRLESIKGADMIIPAFKVLLSKYPQSSLRIVGDGSLRSSMEQQQDTLHIPSSKITWKGRISPKQLPNEYDNMDIVWMPSRSEGFGLSAIEAMANGKVVIANNVGGLSEIISNNRNGILVDNIDSSSLAQTTIELLQNPDKISAISCLATLKAQEFSFEKYKENILSFYATL